MGTRSRALRLADPSLFGGAVSPSRRRALLAVLGVAGFAVSTLVGAHVRIPLEPVPVTMQTLSVLLAGALIGPGLGGFSQVLYVTLGLLGAPMFAGAIAGPAVVMGPSGGYLLGFVVAPIVVGRLIHKRCGAVWTLLVFSLASIVILSLGVLHLALFYTRDPWTAVKVGLLPFLVGDTIKVFAAASLYSSYHRLRDLGPRRAAKT